MVDVGVAIRFAAAHPGCDVAGFETAPVSAIAAARRAQRRMVDAEQCPEAVVASGTQVAGQSGLRDRRTGSVDLDQRFIADQVSPTAARVTVSRIVPLYFGRILTGQPTMTVETGSVRT